MKRFVATLTLFFVCTCCLLAQKDSLLICSERADICLSERDLIGARYNYKKALEFVTSDLRYEQTVLSLNLISVLIDMAEYSEAYELVEDVQSILISYESEYPELKEELDYQKACLQIAVGDVFSASLLLEDLVYKEDSLDGPALRTLLELYVEQGHYESVICLAYEMLAVSSTDDMLYLTRILSRAYAGIGNEECAMKYLQISDQCLSQMPEDVMQSMHQYRLKGEIAENFGRNALAFSYYERAYKMFSSVFGEFHPESLSLKYGMARTSLLYGNYEQARELYLGYLPGKIDYLSSEIMRMNTWEMRSYWNRSNEGLADVALFCHALPQSDDCSSAALNTTMFVKSLLSETSIGLAESVERTGDLELIEKYEYLKDLRMRYSQSLRMGKSVTDQMRSEAASVELDIRLALEQRGMSGNLVSYPDWKKVAETMNPNTVAVEFVHFNAGAHWQYSAFVYRSGSVAPIYVPLCTQESLLECIVTPYLYSDYSVPDSTYDASFSSVYDLIWEPLEPYFHPDDMVCFSPSGLLHHIPLEYLEKEGVMFAETYPEVRRMTVTKDIPLMRRADDFDAIEVFGDIEYSAMSRSRFSSLDFQYLPAGSMEIDNIRDIFAESGIAKIHRGMDATEADFKDIPSQKFENMLLHISSHGYYCPLESAASFPYYNKMDVGTLGALPLHRCGIALAGANKAWRGLPLSHDSEDGILTGQEISEMDLRGVSLVVLAACQTGIGDLGRDGASSLQKAFHMAGAESLMVSLWPVDDTCTMLLMTYFYESLASGETAHRSLVKAVRRIKDECVSAYYYAPYVIIDEF